MVREERLESAPKTEISARVSTRACPCGAYLRTAPGHAAHVVFHRVYINITFSRLYINTTSKHPRTHWSRNQVSNIPEIIPGASPRGPKRSIGVPGCANGSLFCQGKRPPFSPPSCRASPHCERRAFTREASRSRLERSWRKRAASEGVVVPKEGCPTARRFFRHRVRAVQSIWQTV